MTPHQLLARIDRARTEPQPVTAGTVEALLDLLAVAADVIRRLVAKRKPVWVQGFAVGSDVYAIDSTGRMFRARNGITWELLPPPPGGEGG